MNNPTQLLPTDLILVEVPEDATEILLKGNLLIGYFMNPIPIIGKFELLGEVTADSISNGLDDFLKYEWSWTELDFRDLLQSNGFYFVNPIEKPKGTNLESSFFEMQVDFNQEKQWQEAESKLIKKGVILKPIKL